MQDTGRALATRSPRRCRPGWVWLAAGIITMAGVGCGGDSGGGGGGGNGGQSQGEKTPSGGQSHSGSANLAGEGFDAPRNYWRIHLTVDNGKGDVKDVSPVTIPKGAPRPQPHLGGSFLAVAYAGKKVVDAIPFSFPKKLHLEGRAGKARARFSQTEKLTSFATTVYVARTPKVDRIEILNHDGKVAGEIEKDELKAGKQGLRRQELQRLGNPEYNHIKILGPGDEALLPGKIEKGKYYDRIAKPSKKHLEELKEGLSKIGPNTLASVHTIALVEMPKMGCVPLSKGCSGQTAKKGPGACEKLGITLTDKDGNPIPTGIRGGASFGGSLVLNVANFDSGTIVHEAVHCLNNVLDSAGGAGHAKAASWPPEAWQMAGETMRQYRLGHGLTSGWQHLQRTAWDLDKAGNYTYADWCAVTEKKAVDHHKAMSPYATKTSGEDIAVMAEEVQNGPLNPVCEKFKAHNDDDVNEDLALLYAKLLMLKGIGAIDESNFDACVDGVGIKPPAPGVWFGESVGFTDDAKAGYYNYRRTRFFAVLARGPESYQALVETPIPKGKHPVGIYHLNEGLPIFTGGPAVYLNHEKHSLKRQSGHGLLFIAEASKKRVLGAVFYLKLKGALFRETSAWAYTPFLVKF